jgi:hypothetical protein
MMDKLDEPANMATIMMEVLQAFRSQGRSVEISIKIRPPDESIEKLYFEIDQLQEIIKYLKSEIPQSGK